ncbi:MAG: lamin tail domain-containing protein [Candidatus Peregrinibacteria bacterium]|nr:lamin tail domain-containing protein [Candidatus Peregrinibacteria bacterium]
MAKTTKSTTKTPAAVTKTQKLKKVKLPTTKNGDLADNILISEIFPNPKGTDTGQEWIELFNKENRNINLGNWSISINNTSKNTKPKIIKFNDKTIIRANSYLVLDSSTYKFSLLNTNCKIELRDFVGKSINSMKYENSEENLSLSLINILGTNKNITTWTTATKSTANPIYYEISGEIKKKHISSDKNIQSFIEITTKDNKPITITISAKNNSELLNGTLKEKDQVLFLTEKNKGENYLLISFKIIKKAPQNTETDQNKETWIYYIFAPIILGLIWLLNKTFGLHRSIKDLCNIRSS